jgi:hypothetical protein
VHRGLELEKGGQRPSEGHAPLGKPASPDPGHRSPGSGRHGLSAKAKIGLGRTVGKTDGQLAGIAYIETVLGRTEKRRPMTANDR